MVETNENRKQNSSVIIYNKEHKIIPITPCDCRVGKSENKLYVFSLYKASINNNKELVLTMLLISVIH